MRSIALQRMAYVIINQHIVTERHLYGFAETVPRTHDIGYEILDGVHAVRARESGASDMHAPARVQTNTRFVPQFHMLDITSRTAAVLYFKFSDMLQRGCHVGRSAPDASHGDIDGVFYPGVQWFKRFQKLHVGYVIIAADFQTVGVAARDRDAIAKMPI